MTATQTETDVAAEASREPSDETIIKCIGLSKVFRDFWLRNRVQAVEDVNLSVQRGEVYGLLGPNGSGKSTTVKMILGLLYPTAGRIANGAIIERVHAVTPLEIPYIPGLLAFREGNPILAALAELSVDPDLAVFDGSGRIHFRQAGIATHIGVMLDLPSIGVAKRLLCGKPAESVDDRPEGWSTPVESDANVEAPDGTVIGHAYQSRQWGRSQSINPLYISPGHRVSAATTVELVDSLCAGYKLPEPTRLADHVADDVKMQYE